MLSPNRTPTVFQRWACAAAFALSALVAPGCTRLPTQVDRPVSMALSDPGGTPLATLVQQRRSAAAARFDSGFLLLAGPQAAYGSRLALVQGAQKTLDLQYYAIHADASTRRLLDGIREAAARGVRVRILIDDFHSTGRDALVLQLAFEKNIEVRLFNPLPGARDSTLARLLNAVGDAARLQQRMHNKLFLADNVLGVTGGRNLGDAYFGVGQSGNFIDIDVLAAGPIVRDLSRSFDAYWNNARAYPVPSIVSPKDLEAIRARVRDAARTSSDGEAGTASAGATPRAQAAPPRGAASAAAASERVWDEQPLDLRSVPFVWAPAAMLADRPGKIAANPQEEPAGAAGAAGPASPAGPAPTGTPTGGAARAASDAAGLVVALPGTAPTPAPARGATTSLHSAAAAAAGGDTVVEGLLQLLGQTRRDLLIVSPYFVPGPEMERAFARLRQRGVRVRVLTNSLASTDAPIAHVGYARHRKELLGMGLELYEMRSEQAAAGGALGSSGRPGAGGLLGSSGGSATGESRAMLHSKAMVVDGRLLVVGSMNLDLRSQLQNTEVALLIGSKALSGTVTEAVEATLREGAWRVEWSGGRLVWRAPLGSGLHDTFDEPDASLGLRLMVRLLGPLAPDALL